MKTGYYFDPLVPEKSRNDRNQVRWLLQQGDDSLLDSGDLREENAEDDLDELDGSDTLSKVSKIKYRGAVFLKV